MEQKCSSSSPSRMGMERVSSTCMPQTGSRTNRRAVLGVCGELDASPCCCGPEAAFCSNEPKTRRSSHTLQETTSSQNRNRKMRARNVIGAKDRGPALVPPSPNELSVCKAKRGSQTKRRNFKKLRDWGRRGGRKKRGQRVCKSLIYNGLLAWWQSQVVY
jgi:hypothetical protein